MPIVCDGRGSADEKFRDARRILRWCSFWKNFRQENRGRSPFGTEAPSPDRISEPSLSSWSRRHPRAHAAPANSPVGSTQSLRRRFFRHVIGTLLQVTERGQDVAIPIFAICDSTFARLSCLFINPLPEIQDETEG